MTDFIKGLDIASLQGNVDFNALVAEGIQFVILRCYVGNDYIDPNYKTNLAKARAAGLKVACYHFVYPLPITPGKPATRDPKVQAQLHVNNAGDVPVVCCDLEWPEPQDWAKWNCSASQITEWTAAYLDEYERLSGIRPIIYIYPDFAHHINLPAEFGQKYKLWIASYASNPTIPAPWTDWVIWQNTGGGGKTPGGAPVDTDLMKDLSLWDNAPTPVVAPAPTPDPVPVAADPVPAPVPAPEPVPEPAPVVAPPVTTASTVANLETNFIVTIINFIIGAFKKKFSK